MLAVEQIHTTVDSTILVIKDDAPFEGVVIQEKHEMKIRSSQHHNLADHICLLPLVRRGTELEFDEVNVELDSGYSHVLDLVFAKQVEPKPITALPVDLPPSLSFINNLRRVNAKGHFWFEDGEGFERQVDFGNLYGTLTYEVW